MAKVKENLLADCKQKLDDLKMDMGSFVKASISECQAFTDSAFTDCEHNGSEICRRILLYKKDPNNMDF